jgi:hypothetical protein
VIVTLTPPSDASLVTVRLFNGNGAGVYFEFSTFSFQVPIELSAPKAATVVIARAIIAWVRIVRICKAPLNFGGETWLSEIQWCPDTDPDLNRWWKTRKHADRPKQHSRRSALGTDHITTGGFG